VNRPNDGQYNVEMLKYVVSIGPNVVGWYA